MKSHGTSTLELLEDVEGSGAHPRVSLPVDAVLARRLAERR